MKKSVPVLGLLILLGMVACKMPTSGIFYSLENESAITNNAQSGLAKDVPVSRLATFGSSYLIVSGTTLFTTATPGLNEYGVLKTNGTWTAVAGPSATIPACVDLAVSGSTIYGLFTSNANNGSASTDPALYTGSGAATGPTWTALSLTGLSPAGQVADALYTNDSGTTILQTRAYPTGASSPNYYAYRLSGAGIGTQIGGFGSSRRITGLAGLDGNTMVITGDAVYTTNLAAGSPTLSAKAVPKLSDKDTDLKSVSWDGTNTYYVACGSGWLAKSGDSGTSWTVSSAAQYNASSTLIKFTSLVYLKALKDRSGKDAGLTALIAGSAGQSLWRVNTDTMNVYARPSDMSTDKLWSGDYPSAEQSLSSVSSLIPVSGEKVFIGTTNKGLWSFQYDSASTKTTPAKSGLFFTWE